MYVLTRTYALPKREILAIRKTKIWSRLHLVMIKLRANWKIIKMIKMVTKISQGLVMTSRTKLKIRLMPIRRN